MQPNDKDAKLKLAECEKIVKKVEFFRAIEIGDEPSAAEGLDLDAMVVEPEYDGVRLEQEMTADFISDMLERFKNGKKIHKKYAYQIVIAVKKIVYDEATMVEMEIEDDAKLTVCGDTHGRFKLCMMVGIMLRKLGQYFDLMELFRLNGLPTEKHYYLFNGDFVDRGSWSTEIALLLYAYKWLRPKSFFINRGNHETDDMNRVYGFEGECKAKYNGELSIPKLRYWSADIHARRTCIQAVFGKFLSTSTSYSDWQEISCPSWGPLLRRQGYLRRYPKAEPP